MARTREAPSRRPRLELVYGRNAVLEAARAGHLKRVYVADGLEPDPRLDELAELAEVEVVSRERVEAMAQGNHQGVVAELAPREFSNLRALLASNPTLVLGLDGVQDPQNLGAILRSAEASGVDGVVLPERRSAPVTGAVVKASSGASEHVRLIRVSGMASAISDIKRSGLWCVALDVNGEMAPWEFDLTQQPAPHDDAARVPSLHLPDPELDLPVVEEDPLLRDQGRDQRRVADREDGGVADQVAGRERHRLATPEPDGRRLQPADPYLRPLEVLEQADVATHRAGDHPDRGDRGAVLLRAAVREVDAGDVHARRDQRAQRRPRRARRPQRADDPGPAKGHGHEILPAVQPLSERCRVTS